MMLPAFRQSATWVLIAMLVIISGVGEGLHSLPGCGHGILVGNRVLLLGIDLPDAASSADGPLQFGRPGETDIPILDEDSCAICSVVGATATAGGSTPQTSAALLTDQLPAAASVDVPAVVLHSVQARAPPLV